jgi:hypothetical protein
MPLSVGASGEPDTFTRLFAHTCMKHFYSQDKLRQDMASNPVLQGKPSSFFLGGKPGTAWSVQADTGKYVVSLRDDNVCAVFAQRANISEVQDNFVSLVAVARDPLISIEREPAGPNSDTLKTVSYAWTRPKDKTELLFTLTTSAETSPTVQAMASLAVTAKKPNNSFKGKPLRGSP